MRIEPAPSVGERGRREPAATAAAEPPLEPPGERPGSHGLRVTPHVADSVNGHCIQLGHVRLAEHDRAGGAQAADDLGVRGRRAVHGAVPLHRDLAGDVGVVLDSDRHAEQRPLVAARRGGRSAWSASVSARSANTTRNALSCGSIRAIRSRYSSTSSRGVTCARAQPGSAWPDDARRRRDRRGPWRR